MVQPVPEPRPVLEIAQKSDPGRDPNKQVNEDACAYRETRVGHLLVVCDGMGGHAAGREASNAAVQTIVTMVEGAPEGLAPSQVLRGAIEQAGRVVFQLGGSGAFSARPGSTVVALLMHAGGTDVAHVGDSRVYCIRSGQIYPLTRDHSMVQQLVDAGMLKPEEAHGHPDANKITRALGLRAETEVEVRSEPMPQHAGDIFLLATDGLLDVVLPDEILGVVLGASGVEDACAKLVELANARGGPDNVTVQLARVIEPGLRTPPPAPLPTHTLPPTFTDVPGGAVSRSRRGSGGASPTAIDEPLPDDGGKPSRRGGLLLGLGVAGVGLVIVAVSLWWLLGRGQPAAEGLAAAPSATATAMATEAPSSPTLVPVVTATATSRGTPGGRVPRRPALMPIPLPTALPAIPTSLPSGASSTMVVPRLRP